jgi:DNA-directed RNA polymerase specialized sigma24 family protein
MNTKEFLNKIKGMVIIYAINTYKDLCTEIDIANMNISRLKNEKKSLEVLLKAPGELKAQTYSDMPHGSKDFITLDRLIPRINRVDVRLEREEMILKGMLEQKELMNIKLRSLTGMQYKIFKLKEVDGLNYIQISQRLNVSKSTVEKIIAKVKKKYKIKNN